MYEESIRWGKCRTMMESRYICCAEKEGADPKHYTAGREEEYTRSRNMLLMVGNTNNHEYLSCLHSMSERESLSMQKGLTDMEMMDCRYKRYQTPLKVYRMAGTSIISIYPELCNMWSWRFACSRCVRSLLLAMLERESLSMQKWLTDMEHGGLQVKWHQTNLKVYRMTCTSIISMHPQLCNMQSWRFACSRCVFSSVRRIGCYWLMASTKTCMFSTCPTIAEVTCIYWAAWAWSRLPLC